METTNPTIYCSTERWQRICDHSHKSSCEMCHGPWSETINGFREKWLCSSRRRCHILLPVHPGSRRGHPVHRLGKGQGTGTTIFSFWYFLEHSLFWGFNFFRISFFGAASFLYDPLLISQNNVHYFYPSVVTFLSTDGNFFIWWPLWLQPYTHPVVDIFFCHNCWREWSQAAFPLFCLNSFFLSSSFFFSFFLSFFSLSFFLEQKTKRNKERKKEVHSINFTHIFLWQTQKKGKNLFILPLFCTFRTFAHFFFISRRRISDSVKNLLFRLIFLSNCVSEQKMEKERNEFHIWWRTVRRWSVVKLTFLELLSLLHENGYYPWFSWILSFFCSLEIDIPGKKKPDHESAMNSIEMYLFFFLSELFGRTCYLFSLTWPFLCGCLSFMSILTAVEQRQNILLLEKKRKISVFISILFFSFLEFFRVLSFLILIPFLMALLFLLTETRLKMRAADE